MNDLERNLRARMGDANFESAYKSAFGGLRADRTMGDYPLHSVVLRTVQDMLNMQDSIRAGEEPNPMFMPFGVPGVPTPEPDSLRIIQGSRPTISNPNNNSGGNSGSGRSGGCYIATAVYGSYNCPEVWTLRRYRDYRLAKTWYGRLFIRTYYTLSPLLVKCFGKTKWFKRLWKERLNKTVERLQSEGVADTPYEDKKG